MIFLNGFPFGQVCRKANTRKSGDFSLSKPTSEQSLKASAEHLRERGQKIGGLVPTNVVMGYHVEDVNMDGLVKYSGLDNDRDIILQNIGGAIPTATILEQLPE